MKKAEIIIVTISIIVFGLNLFLFPNQSALTVLAMTTLSVFYLFFSVVFFNNISFQTMLTKGSYKDISTLRIFGTIGTGFALSVATIGLLFKFMTWAGASSNLLFALFFLLIVTVIAITKYLKTKSDFYKNILKRAIIIGGLGLVTFLLPKTVFVEIKFRNHPAYLDVLKKAMANPDNEELWNKVNDERQKMINDK